MKREVIVKWKIEASQTARILELLPELAAKSRAEAGNISYAIYQSEADPNVFILHESYTDVAAADAHRTSEHYLRIVATEILPHLEVREVTFVRQLS